MKNFILVLSSFIFSMHSVNVTNKQSINTQIETISNPSIHYKINLFFQQNETIYWDDLGLIYLANFDFEFKDFKNYSHDYYEYKISFELFEEIIEHNDKVSTKIEKVDFPWSTNDFGRVNLDARRYVTNLNKEVIVKPFLTFTYHGNDIASIKMSHPNLMHNGWIGQDAFASRTVEIKQLTFSIRPKQDFSFMNHEKVSINYNPLLLEEQLSDLNAVIDEKINIILDKNRVNRHIFNYFYKIDDLADEDINMLSQVKWDLNGSFFKKFTLKSEMANDKILKDIYVPQIDVEFNQYLSIEKLGIPDKIHLNQEESNIESDDLYQLLFNDDAILSRLILIEKKDKTHFRLFSNNSKVKGSKIIEIIFNSTSNNEEAIVIDSNIKHDEAENAEESESGEIVRKINTTTSENKKPVLMLGISLLFLVAMNVPFVFKKIFAKFKKK